MILFPLVPTLYVRLTGIEFLCAKRSGAEMDAQGIFVRICMETQFVLREIAEGPYLFL